VDPASLLPWIPAPTAVAAALLYEQGRLLF